MKHLLLIGTPGCGRTLYARTLRDAPGALKHLTACEGALVPVYRAGGLDVPPPLTVPFRAPHPTVSDAGLTGQLARGFVFCPGEMSLAHGGILFLDEAVEFRKSALAAVLLALRTGEIQLHGEHGTRIVAPAQFRLIMATSPCPCGYYGAIHPRSQVCLCSEAQRARYLERIAPLRERCEVVEEEEIRARVKAQEALQAP
jgi:magnesium chelatase family protein